MIKLRYHSVLVFVAAILLACGLAWTTSSALGEPTSDQQSGQENSQAIIDSEGQDAQDGQDDGVDDAAQEQTQNQDSSSSSSQDSTDSDDPNAQDGQNAADDSSASADDDADAAQSADANKAQARGAGDGMQPLGTNDMRTRLGEVTVSFVNWPKGQYNNHDGSGSDNPDTYSNETTVTGDKLSIHPADNEEVAVTVQVVFTTSGSEPAKPGEIELYIPRSIYETRWHIRHQGFLALLWQQSRLEL